MEMKIGCKVPFLSQIKEGWEIAEEGISANVGADKVEMLLAYFILQHEEPIFSFLELPCRLDEEEELQSSFGGEKQYREELGQEVSIVRKTHKKVYYLDGCTQEEALGVLVRVKDILIPDGMAEFGFGVQTTGEEISFGKYNVLSIYTFRPEMYRPAFEKLNIPLVTKLVTAWDIISPDCPGTCESVETNGKSAYDVPRILKDWGMYLAEIREE